MPSGDASCAAAFCAVIAYEYRVPQIYAIMPLVMLGRVYYQCHWIGDTVAGLFVGSLFGILGSSNFHSIVRYLQQTTGVTGFIPEQV